MVRIPSGAKRTLRCYPQNPAGGAANSGFRAPVSSKEKTVEATPQTALVDDRAPQPGRALTIRRIFTTAGVHPFDSVEWETRDARIGHGDKVAFEQPDVELPK